MLLVVLFGCALWFVSAEQSRLPRWAFLHQRWKSCCRVSKSYCKDRSADRPGSWSDFSSLHSYAEKNCRQQWPWYIRIIRTWWNKLLKVPRLLGHAWWHGGSTRIGEVTASQCWIFWRCFILGWGILSIWGIQEHPRDVELWTLHWFDRKNPGNWSARVFANTV